MHPKLTHFRCLLIIIYYVDVPPRAHRHGLWHWNSPLECPREQVGERHPDWLRWVIMYCIWCTPAGTQKWLKACNNRSTAKGIRLIIINNLIIISIKKSKARQRPYSSVVASRNLAHEPHCKREQDTQHLCSTTVASCATYKCCPVKSCTWTLL